MGSTNNVVYEFGPFRVAPARRLLLREGEPAAITARVFDLLVALVERAGQVVTKDELIDIVWQGAAGEGKKLTVCKTAPKKSAGQTAPPLPVHNHSRRRGLSVCSRSQEVDCKGCPAAVRWSRSPATQGRSRSNRLEVLHCSGCRP